MANENCAKCGKPLTNQRKKFCDDVCQYRFNSIKKDNESHLPPVKKRNKEWCHVYMGYSNTMSGRGQGKRSNGTVKGGMAGNVCVSKEELKPFSIESVEIHFKPKQGHSFVPNYIQLGDGTRLTKEEAETLLINQDTAIYAAQLTR